MKKHWFLLAVAVFAAFASLSAWSQRLPVHGTVKEEGNPVVGADVVLVNKDNGMKFTMKTDKKGEFLNIGILLGVYHMTVSVSGQLRYEADLRVADEAKEINVDLAKEKKAAEERALQQLTPEQRKKLQEEREAQQKERAKVQTLNQKLAEADAAEKAGSYDLAVSIYAETTKMDPNRDILWARYGQALLTAATNTKDRSLATQDYTEAGEAYKKALAIKPSDGGYHNNLGQAYAKLGKTEDAIREYDTAAQLDPANAAMYFFNLGAVLTNAGKVDEANTAFDKAIAADPKRAEAYYQKGLNLLGKATLDKTGRTIAPPGAEESLKKYLELEPAGRFATSAKEILASLGAKVETTFKQEKKKK